jgi:hypothetical protein
LPGAEATLVTDTEAGLVYDLRIADLFSEPTRLSLADSMFGVDGFSLDGTATVQGGWQLDLRVGASQEDGFFIDPSHSGFELDLLIDQPLFATGLMGANSFTVEIDPINVALHYEVDFLNPGGTAGIDLDEILQAPLNLLATTRLDGSAALVAELVNALDAANPPPALTLEWNDLNQLEPSADNLQEVLESWRASGYLIGFNLDVDGNGETDALTDGLLISGYLAGLRGSLSRRESSRSTRRAARTRSKIIWPTVSSFSTWMATERRRPTSTQNSS